MAKGRRRIALAALLAAIALTHGGCTATRFYEREALADHAMQLDADPGLIYLRDKIEAAREGSLGGFGSATAGSCGCQ